MKKMEEILTEAAERIRGGDEKRVRAQHDAGRLTARERVMELMDPGSFMELETLRKDSNLVAGFGTVHTRPVYCIAQDHASCGGAMTASQAAKMKRTLELAGQTGAPVVLMPDSAGVKVTEGSVALPAYAQVFSAMTALSGVSPMLCYVAGQCTGIAVMMTQLADLTVQVQKNGLVAMHAATVMNSEKGHAKSEEALFGADTMTLQGAVALKAEDEKSGLGLVKQLLDALPSSNLEDAPYVDTDELNRLLKTEDAQDAVSLCHELADGGRTIELFADYGTRAHTVFAHIGGRSAGLVLTDHAQNGGRPDAETCGKIARFVQLCDCFDLPVVTVVNTDGLSVPAPAEQAKMYRASAQMLYAYSEASCPKVALITGNAIGAAYVTMGGKAMADMTFAWPEAVIAPVTPEVAAAAFDDAKLSAGESREKLEDAYRESTNAQHAAENALVDEVIRPADSRKVIIAALEYLSVKRDSRAPRKHGNMPL